MNYIYLTNIYHGGENKVIQGNDDSLCFPFYILQKSKQSFARY
jgi:hypothetical protein